ILSLHDALRIYLRAQPGRGLRPQLGAPRGADRRLHPPAVDRADGAGEPAAAAAGPALPGGATRLAGRAAAARGAGAAPRAAAFHPARGASLAAGLRPHRVLLPARLLVVDR